MKDLIYNVSSNPHVRDKSTTGSIMSDVLVALIPASVLGVYNFGIKAAILIIVTTMSAILAEALFELLLKRRLTIGDWSAAVTGMLLAFNLPYDFPVWMAVLGAFFAIIVVKQVFGGIGQNFMNPALAARCFLLLSFGTKMTVFTYDGITGATPLAALKAGESVDIKAMFLGVIPGTIGETSTIAILMGALYLLIRKVISIKIPLTYILTFSVFVTIFGSMQKGSMIDVQYLLAHLCGGGLMLGAFFMATDYVTSPITNKGKIVFGIILGILTGIFRLYGPNAEGVSYAIIFGNLLVPLIEKVTMPCAFGREKVFWGKALLKKIRFTSGRKDGTGYEKHN